MRYTGRKLLLISLALAVLALVCAAPALGEGSVRISEVMSSNGTYKNGHAYDWVELHNVSGKTLDLSGYYMSDSAKKPFKWAFPEGTKVKKDGFLLVYCTGEEMEPGKGSVFYASFKLSASGDEVVLTGPDGETVDSVSFPAQYGNIAWGLDKSGRWGYLEESTPGKVNSGSACDSRAEAPVLLTEPGFYSGSVTVQAS